jgi:hypothetical protein
MSAGWAGRQAWLAIQAGAPYFERMEDGAASLAAGWIVRLSGDEFDFKYWEQSLRLPFDPWCDRLPQDGRLVLRSHRFYDLQSADEVRKRAIPLIQLLNGALGVEVGAEPVGLDGVGRIDDQGEVHLTTFGELNVQLRGFTLTATGEVLDSEGNPIPPAPPRPSNPQRWIGAAEKNDQIADMLVFAGRSDNWFDIYKALELAETLAGHRNKLRVLLGASADECERMWRTANSYRHARDKNKPMVLTTLAEARPLLSYIVRTILGNTPNLKYLDRR